MRHGSKRMRDAGCECDGCRLSALVTYDPPPNTVKLDATPYRYVMGHAFAGGVTVTALAARSGVSRAELTSIWYGRREFIQQRTAAKLREALLSYAEGS